MRPRKTLHRGNLPVYSFLLPGLRSLQNLRLQAAAQNNPDKSLRDKRMAFNPFTSGLFAATVYCQVKGAVFDYKRGNRSGAKVKRAGGGKTVKGIVCPTR